MRFLPQLDRVALRRARSLLLQAVLLPLKSDEGMTVQLGDGHRFVTGTRHTRDGLVSSRARKIHLDQLDPDDSKTRQ